MAGLTYSADDWRRAQQAWVAGEFGPEWDDVRAAARARGFIFPPSGSRHDSIEDNPPSQRAIVHRAIEDTPLALLLTVRSSRSWSHVVDRLIASSNTRRVAAEADEDAEATRKRRQRPVLLTEILAGAQAHRVAQLEAVAAKAREVVRISNDPDDGDVEDVLTELEGLLLALEEAP